MADPPGTDPYGEARRQQEAQRQVQEEHERQQRLRELYQAGPDRDRRRPDERDLRREARRDGR